MRPLNEDEKTAQAFEATKEFMLLATIDEAEKAGLTPAFMGQYRQSPKGSRVEYSCPFIIAQTPEQIRELDRSRLEGICLEIDVQAKISGTISPERIEFAKLYIPETSLIDDKLDHTITYSGTSPDGNQYEGNWSFPDMGGDMEPTGTFTLYRIKDLRRVRKELQRTMGD